MLCKLFTILPGTYIQALRVEHLLMWISCVTCFHFSSRVYLIQNCYLDFVLSFENETTGCLVSISSSIYTQFLQILLSFSIIFCFQPEFHLQYRIFYFCRRMQWISFFSLTQIQPNTTIINQLSGFKETFGLWWFYTWS